MFNVNFIMVLVVLVIILIISSIKVIKEYERAVVFRLGRLLPPPQCRSARRFWRRQPA